MNILKNKNVKINKSVEKLERKNIILRTKNVFLIFILIFLLLIIRIVFVQFIKGPEYKETASRQQLLSQVISPKRGTIYDSTGKALAISASVDTITINPQNISVKDKDPDVARLKTKERKEIVAKGLSEIFELDYDETLNKVKSDSTYQIIAKKVTQEKVNELNEWMKENKIYDGINIDETEERFYPYENFASNLIGFCGTDGYGLEGIEERLNSVLTGTSGRKVSSGDSQRKEIPNSNELYVEAENGSNIILTLDYNIQTIAEKYLKQAVDENDCKKGGNIIIMQPDTGDVLAMATYPNYNLNTPFSPNTTELEKDWKNMSAEEKANAQYAMWKNLAVSQNYEPGSTFKIITSAIALEEDIVGVDGDEDFLCTGAEKIYDTKIKCWRSYNPHGYQSLREALQNSCNPAFIQLGEKIGVTTFYKYLNAFGFMNKTNSLFYGESNSVFHDREEVGPIELATLSFGQRFTVTPLQLVTAISSIANDGVLMQPRIVKQIINTDTNITTNIDPVEVRKVLSVETCEELKSMLESVVTSGTGKYAAVEGYTIGGKTGTSEPIQNDKNSYYVASYVAISPIVDTKVCVLVTLYDPQGKSHEGGQIAAPVISQIMSEVLPYLGIASDKDNTSNEDETIMVPEIRNKTLAEAIKVLEKSGFKTLYNIEGDKNKLLVTDQVPKPGVKLSEDSIICLYTTENDSRTTIKMPDLKGKTLKEAVNMLRAVNLNYTSEGSGKVISQSVVADEAVEEGSVIKLTLKKEVKDTY